MLTKKTNFRPLWILIVSSLSIALLLAFFNGGSFNSNWMEEGSGWAAAMINAVVIFLGQYLLYGVLFRKTHFPGKILLSMFFGVIVGVMAMFLIFYTLQ